jgi:hypothetical protein
MIAKKMCEGGKQPDDQTAGQTGDKDQDRQLKAYYGHSSSGAGCV